MDTLAMLTGAVIVVLASGLDGFKAMSGPPSLEEKQEANATLEWDLALTPGGVAASIRDRNTKEPSVDLPFEVESGFGHRRASAALKTSDGFLVGIDNGEWGGSMRLYGTDGRLIDTLAEENTPAIFKLGDDVISLQGLNHLLIHEGSVRFWHRGKEGFFVLQRNNLDSGPIAWASTGGAIWVVTLGGLTQVSGREVRQVHQVDLSWLHPKTVVVDQTGDVWIGMARYVLHLKKQSDGFAEEWLTAPLPPGADMGKRRTRPR